MTGADLSHVLLYRAKLHRIIEEHMNWAGANREPAVTEDPDWTETEGSVFAPGIRP